MTTTGYYHSPTIHQNTIVFVCEDDLWTVAASGGVARRLTANLGAASWPALSPDGTLLAFTGEDEGSPEIYCMPAEGGLATRLTYIGTDAQVVGWSLDGENIIFAANHGQPYFRDYKLYAMPHTGGETTLLPTGRARSISFGPRGGLVIGRNTTDLAHWKRYRGGRTGDIWIDPRGKGNWRRLIDLDGNIALPLWIGGRIYFISDHGGIGNLYSCRTSGKDLRQHTYHTDFYARHPTANGKRIVYHAGADLYLFDPQTSKSAPVEVQFNSPRVQRKRKFIPAAEYLEMYGLHPEGHSVALTARGKPFTMANWEGAAVQYGHPHGTRYKLATWLHTGKDMAVISDSSGEERLEIHSIEAAKPSKTLPDLDIGQPQMLLASPCKLQLALSNHRYELILVDLESKSAKTLDRSRHNRIRGAAWSPDGKWLAYGFHPTAQTSIIKLCRLETGETYAVTDPVLRDANPAFDPEGKYLYFLSYRNFSPVYDNLHFDLNFPWGMRPYLLTLQADLPSPFEPLPRAPGEKASPANNKNNSDDKKEDDDKKGKKEKKEPTPVKIDLEGIARRVLAFPVTESRYGQIRGLKGKVLFSSYPIESARAKSNSGPPAAKGRLQVYNFEDQESQTLINSLTSFDISMNGKTMIYRAGNRLRVLKAGEKPNGQGNGAGRKTGWLDLNRLKILVEPQAEWEQMYREAWRLQRDHFWTDDMSSIDWQTVYQRYFPLIERVGTRGEFSDLLWEMQGELGTSHAYAIGGDYRPEPHYSLGFLGADFAYDAESDSYRLTHIVQGDPWEQRARSPLAKPGLNLKPGDRLVAINRRQLSKTFSPQQALINQAGNEALLTFAANDNDSSKHRTVTVKPLYSERAARYREWVERNRQTVHAATGGRVGYIHIPDMGANGYAEFHRGYLAEVDREGLVIDARNNRGGHVSSLILEKLARRRLGYDIQRWAEPTPYPPETLIGPMAALCNESSASDGDMFSHAFKMMGLGPLIGTRTWGGVIGYSLRGKLVDGGYTTQPEFSAWFSDIGWQLENYGAEPDIEVINRPQDEAAGRDPQLERAIKEVMKRLKKEPPTLPSFDHKPNLTLPE